jgi:DNA-binding CsgD family transcriptional regulator
MYLTGREQALVADIFKVLADSVSEQQLLREVGRRLLDLLQADYLGSYAWDGGAGEFDRETSDRRDGAFSGYARSAQYRDSLTPRLQRRRTAVRVTEAMPYDEPMHRDPHSEVLRSDGLYWGLNLFAWTDGENVGDLRVWRGQHRDNFSDHELALLELVRPALAAALARTRAQAPAANPPDGHAAAGSDDAFACLTRREREVVELVIEGLLDKEIAQRLGISYTTVRTHVDRSFQKLGVSNRSRLARIVRPDRR